MLDDIHKLQELKFYYKFENSQLPCYLSRLPFIRNTRIYGHATRINLKIHHLKPNHEHVKKCRWNNITLLVNSTPSNIPTVCKVVLHNMYVKHYHIVKSCKESCCIVNCYIWMRKLSKTSQGTRSYERYDII